MEETKSKSSATIKNYHLKMKFNGKEFECDTNNLKESIMSFKPFFLKTNVNFSCINDKGEICSSYIPVKRAKMIWRNKVYMDMFINKLIFKHNA